MADVPSNPTGAVATNTSRETGLVEPVWVKRCLIGLSLGFLILFLGLPLANVFYQALAKGWEFYWQSLNTPDARSALQLTVVVALIVLPINVAFGLAAAWAISKFQFRGKALLLTLIDLPFSVSPVVAGLMYVLLYGLQGYLGPWLDAYDVQIIFALPGIVLTSLFVTLPFVARELVPVMQATGSEQEQAAVMLGASGWQTFWHVTLPSVKGGLLYGIILCNARAIGEFGAVSVVSGHIAGQTDTLPLAVEKLYQEFNGTAAFALASLLAVMALGTLAAKSFLEWQAGRREHTALR